MARFLHLSDLHQTAPGGLMAGVLQTATLLREAIDTILDRREALGAFDAAIVTGDISDDGTPESYATARAQLDRLGLPLVAVPGNHDLRETFRDAFADLPGMGTGALTDGITEIAGVCIVGLDTLVEGQDGGRLRAESLSVLSAALRDAQGPVIVALHHPPLPTGMERMDAIGLDGAAGLADALAAHAGPLQVLAGHVHGVYQGLCGGHPVSVALSVCTAAALDRRPGAPIQVMSGPTGFALLDMGSEPVWTAQVLDRTARPIRGQPASG